MAIKRTRRGRPVARTPKPEPQQTIGLSCSIHEKPFDTVDLANIGRRYQRTENVTAFVELLCRDCQTAVAQLKELRRVMEMLRVPALPESESEPEEEYYE